MSHLASVFSFLGTNFYFAIFFLCFYGALFVMLYYVINRIDFLRIFGHLEPVPGGHPNSPTDGHLKLPHLS